MASNIEVAVQHKEPVKVLKEQLLHVHKVHLLDIDNNQLLQEHLVKHIKGQVVHSHQEVRHRLPFQEVHNQQDQVVAAFREAEVVADHQEARQEVLVEEDKVVEEDKISKII